MKTTHPMRIDFTAAELDMLIAYLGGGLQSIVRWKFADCIGEDLCEAADREMSRGSLKKSYAEMKGKAEALGDEYPIAAIALEVAEDHLESLDEEAEESAEMVRVYRKLWHTRHPWKS